MASYQSKDSRLNVRQLSTLFVFLIALNLPAIAQTYSGGVRGSITDPGGASVAGASITLTDESTHQTRNTTSR
jgi:hypothetical protein